MIPLEREKHPKEYVVMETATLKKLKKSKLFEVILRFDNEVMHLQKELKSATEELCAKKIETEELKDQLKFVKDTNQLLSSELLVSNSSFTIIKKKLELALRELKKYTNIDNNTFNFQGENPLEEHEKLNESLNKAKEEIKNHEKENMSLKNAMKELKDSKKTIEFELIAVQDSLSKKNQALKEALDAANSKNMKKKEEINELKSQISSFESEIFKLNKKYQTEISKIHEEKATESSYMRNKIEKYKAKISNEKQNSVNQETVKLLSLQYEDLKTRYAKLMQNNRQLNQRLIKMKKQGNSHRSENENPKNVATESNLNTKVVAIKSNLDKIYKDYIGQISRSIENDESFYTLGSYMFTNIEKQLNTLISDLYEVIQEHQASKPTPIRNSRSSRMSRYNSPLLDYEKYTPHRSSSRKSTHN